jgi:GDPmannose 4,6-dehydratase
MSKTALITGITGQDGSWLAEFLLKKGYKVVGLKRRASTENLGRVQHILKDLYILDGDLIDTGSLQRAVKASAPDEVYNLASQSFVHSSFSQPELTAEVTGLGVGRILEAVSMFAPQARFYQASSSEIYGSSPPPQNEKTPFHPRSPYGVAKLFGYWMTVNHRERPNGIFACNGILYNHESYRRGSEFVTQKIAQAAAAIKAGKKKKLSLGNLEAKRDWGHALDYVEAMWMMLQHDTPDDYVVATGTAHTVREFAEIAFAKVGLDYKEFVEIDPQYYRPTEVDYLLGDATKARDVLGWKPKISFEALVTEMVEYAVAHPESWGNI